MTSAQSSVTLFGVIDGTLSHSSTKSEYFNANPLYVAGANGQFVLNQAALAQPTTTPFGRKQSATSLGNSGAASSRLGFRGIEDLGGGLAASFWLEASIAPDTGLGKSGSTKSGNAFAFDRRSTVSLSGPFGEVRLGRDYLPTFWNDTNFDPFGTNGSGTSIINAVNSYLVPGSATSWVDGYVRSNNSIGYFLPANLGGFYGQVMYALPEKTAYSAGVPNSAYNSAVTASACPTGLASAGSVSCDSSSTNRYIGGRFGYANGPVDVAVAYGQFTANDVSGSGLSLTNGGAASSAISASRKLNTFNLGASYDFGVVKLFGEYSRIDDKNASTTSLSQQMNLSGASFASGTGSSAAYTDKYTGYLVGATMPIGAGLIRVAYSHVKFGNGQVPGTTSSFSYPPLTFNSNLTALSTNPDASVNRFAVGYVHNLSKRTALYTTVGYTRAKNSYNNSAIASAVGGLSVSGATALTGWAPKSSTSYDFGIRHSF